MAVAHVTTGQFQKEVLESETPVLVDFYADWCGPCKMMAPILEKLAIDVAGRAKVLKVNVERDPELAGRYRISGVPTLLLFKGGVIAKVSVGLTPAAQLQRMIDEVAAVAG